MKRLLSVLLILCLVLSLTGCGSSKEEKSIELTVIGSLDLKYATQYSVDYCEGGYRLI